MKRTLIFLMGFLSALLIHGQTAQQISPPIKASYQSVTDNMGWQVFEFENSDNSVFYPSFWICPSEIGEDQITSYQVYLNGIYAGSITPAEGNWQTAILDEPTSLRMISGLNRVSIGAPLPEIPLVSYICLDYSSDIMESFSEAYDEYLSAASCSTNVSSSNDLNNSNWPYDFSSIPLKYSFYTTVYRNAGTNLNVMAYGDVPFIIDFFSYFPTSSMIRPPIGGEIILRNEEGEVASPQYSGSQIPMWSFNASQIQNTTKHAFSEPSQSNPNYHIANAIFHAPLDGMYMVKLRSLNNDESGTATLQVGNSTYTQVPVYSAYRDIDLPHSTEYIYVVMSACETTDDPMLFIEGNEGLPRGRVVGVNDNCRASLLEDFLLGPMDALLIQSSILPVTGVHVANYSSANPESTCNVSVCYDSSHQYAKPGVSGIVHVSPDNSVSVSPSMLNLGDCINIESDNEINSLRVYDMKGLLIGTPSVTKGYNSFTTSECGIFTHGMYLVSVHTDKGMKCVKIFVK